jgi:hypothetical protein
MTSVAFLIRDALYLNDKVADADLRYSDDTEAQLRMSVVDTAGTEHRYLINVEVY